MKTTKTKPKTPRVSREKQKQLDWEHAEDKKKNPQLFQKVSPEMKPLPPGYMEAMKARQRLQEFLKDKLGYPYTVSVNLDKEDKYILQLRCFEAAVDEFDGYVVEHIPVVYHQTPQARK